jgi:broad specificity phosphatase PhoE
MTMPLTLTLIRHGESESNVAKSALEKGVEIPREKELMKVHTSERRLTPLGIQQSQKAGVWVDSWLDTEGITREPAVVRCYVSPYVRAAETAGFMKLDVKWRIDNRLCERNWGELDQMTHKERRRLFKEKLLLRKEHAFFWRPSDGETLQDVFLRIRDLIGTLHRECTDMHVIVVSHGETMWAWRTILEYWLPKDLSAAMSSDDERMDMMNCRVVQYSRFDGTGVPRPHFARVRFVNPMKPNDPATNHDWIPVKRRLWGSEDLLKYAGTHERFLEQEAPAA